LRIEISYYKKENRNRNQRLILKQAESLFLKGRDRLAVARQLLDVEGEGWRLPNYLRPIFADILDLMSVGAEQFALSSKAHNMTKSTTGVMKIEDVEDFNAPNDFKSIADYKRFARATWG